MSSGGGFVIVMQDKHFIQFKKKILWHSLSECVRMKIGSLTTSVEDTRRPKVKLICLLDPKSET